MAAIGDDLTDASSGILPGYDLDLVVFNCTSSNATSDVIGDKQDEQAKVNLSREIKLRLQTATHTAMVSRKISNILTAVVLKFSSTCLSRHYQINARNDGKKSCEVQS